MKKIILILCVLAITACKSDKGKSSQEAVVLKGLYLYYADAAILQTPTEVYGVIVDENSMKLDEQVKPYKTVATDMVPVEIKGEIIPKAKDEEGWPNTVKIVEILKVSKPNSEKKDIITLGK
ncbi:MAG: hypothetical protein ACPGU9_07680 [Flavobacteriaceae bacterium]